jgi:FAD/FMN-containing dehydrogenase
MRSEPRKAVATDTEHVMAAALRSSMRGEVIDRAHPGYDDARRVWNGLIDRHPAMIARCADTADVVEAIRAARAYRPTVSIRGGGHQVAGSAVCDDGLVIDLSHMKGVHIDPTARIARAQAGVTWGELDRETQLFGLATPGGEVSVTGVAGLTLGGGLGVLMRAYGLSCDNVRSIEIVTADGMVRTASRDEHPELFWAARGGGRGLGVVTSFAFDLHPLGPEVASALVLYPYDDARSILRAWREVTLAAPDAVTPEIGLWSVPPDPEIPSDMHGSKVVMVAGVYAGSPTDAGPVLAPLKQLGTPLADLSATVPYIESQSALDDLFPDGGRYYWKSHFMDDLTDEVIATLVERDRDRANPSPPSTSVPSAVPSAASAPTKPRLHTGRRTSTSASTRFGSTRRSTPPPSAGLARHGIPCNLSRAVSTSTSPAWRTTPVPCEARCSELTRNASKTSELPTTPKASLKPPRIDRDSLGAATGVGGASRTPSTRDPWEAWLVAA